MAIDRHPEKRARSLSAAKETPLSCAKAGNLGLNGSGRKDRIQQVCRGGAADEPQALRPCGNYGTEFSARQEEVIRRTSDNRKRFEKCSTGYRTTARRPARKTRKKAGKTRMAGSLWSLWKKFGNGRIARGPAKSFRIYTRKAPLLKRQGAGQIRPLCFVAERFVTANRHLRPRSCGIPRLPRGLPAYRRSKSSR